MECDSLSGGAAGELHADLRVTQLIADRDVGAVASERGWGNNLPVVIMPGFMSSGLQVEDSKPCPEWNSERIWFSLLRLTASGGGGAARKSAPIAATVGAKLRAQLIVTVHRGIELAAMDTNGKSDPYVRLELLDAEGRQLAGSGVRESTVCTAACALRRPRRTRARQPHATHERARSLKPRKASSSRRSRPEGSAKPQQPLERSPG